MHRFEPHAIASENAALIDIAVLLIFYNRPDCFARVFEQVRIARPSVVFLYQDGMRAGKDDAEGHQRCREIAESIDWSCTVYRYYQASNIGCDPSGFLAHRWAFSVADKCIVLEDDCVPTQPFFVYCKELLDRYEIDERIHIICGRNNLETWGPCQDSYFYSQVGPIWGWASWSRVIMDCKEDYDWVYDSAHMKLLKQRFKPRRGYRLQKKRWQYCASVGKLYFEVMLGERQLRTDSLNIIPKYNMIENIGVSGGVHCDSSLQLLPRLQRKYFTVKSFDEGLLPLKHPKTIIRDTKYERTETSSWIWRVLTTPEAILLHIVHGRFDILWKKFKLRVLRIRS